MGGNKKSSSFLHAKAQQMCTHEGISLSLPLLTILTKHNKKESVFLHIFLKITIPYIAGLLVWHKRELNKLFKACSAVCPYFCKP